MGEIGESASHLLGVGVDDEGSVTRALGVLLGLTLDETAHGGSIGGRRVPVLVDLVTDTTEVVVGILERDLGMVNAGTKAQGTMKG